MPQSANQTWGSSWGLEDTLAGLERLTALQVKNAKPGDKLSDGGGLRLDVDRSGNRAWVFRFTSPATGKERFMGLGPAGDVTLQKARATAQEARGLVRQGVDPIDARKEQRAAAKVEASRSVTFKTYAEGYVSGREAGWKNDKHRQQWRNSLRTYAYPVIGHLAVADVDTAAVLSVLRPIWQDKPETANRLRGRIEAILSAAKAEEIRAGENPATWRGHLDQVLVSRKKVRAVVHHPALPYADMPRFMASLRGDTSTAALALQFIILTATRYGEAAFATWDEIDRKRKVWTVPAQRMKAGRQHVIPLSGAALAVLDTVSTDAGLIFPGMRDGRPLSDVALAKVIRRHTNTPATTHGFRSTFRDWAGDKTAFPREVAEAALAHVVGDETEAAYRRGSALEKRRELMTAWAEFCNRD